jgi:hypothetical protein
MRLKLLIFSSLYLFATPSLALTLIGEAKLYCADVPNPAHCERLAEFQAKRDLINRVQTWITSQSKVVNNQLEERRIRGISEGILSNSKEIYKAYEDGYFVYKLQAEVEGL